MTITRSERAEFEQFCRQASDAQLRNILEKERAAASRGNEYREGCYQAARLVAAERGLDTEIAS